MHAWRRRIRLLAVFCLAASTGGCPSPTSVMVEKEGQPEGKVTIREGKLANGLKVLFMQDRSAPVVTVQVWYRVGSRNEHKGIRGIAHLTEHMMFKGSENVAPEEHARIIDSVGGTENAFTSEDATAYHDTVPADRMELAMELEAERMARLKLDESLFFKEREVVKEEIRSFQQNDPIGALFEKFRNVAYQKHPYNWTVGGTLADLDNIQIGDVRTFHQTYYAPNNAVLIVVGDTSYQEVLDLAQKHFGPIPAQEPPPEVTAVEPEQQGLRREEIRHPTRLPIVIGGYKVPEAAADDSAVLEVIQYILGGGKSSRIHKQLVRERKLAMFAGAWNWKMRDPGLFVIFGAFMPMVPSKAVEEALIGEVDRLGQEGPTPEELAKAKNQLAAAYVFKLTSMQHVGFEIGMAELVEKDYKNFLKGANPYMQITAEDVKKVVGKYLIRERLTMAILLPAKQDEQVEKQAATEVKEAGEKSASWPTAERFLKLPAPSAEVIELPRIVRKTLQSGLKLMVIERHEQPVVYFDLMVPGGNLLDLKGKAGLADLLAEMLTQGTKTRSAEQIAVEAESLGGNVSVWASTEFFSVNGQFLVRDFKKGLQLFADVALNPTFPKEELTKVRPQVEAGVRRTKDQPIPLAMEHLRYAIYGYDHPRGRPASIQTLQAVTTEDLAEVYRRAFQPQGALLTVVGDLDADETAAALDQAFASWKKTGEVATFPPDPKPLEGPIVRMVDKPDLTQATVAVGQLGIARKDPDYLNLVLGNYILGGGGFSSRFMKNIRAKGGKTYHASSRFSTGRTKGPFMAFTYTRNREMSATLKMLLDEIEKIRKEGVTVEELQAAKNNLAGSYAIDLQSPSGLADELSSAEFYGLGEEFVRNYRRLVTAPTRDDVNHALKKHLKIDNLALVVVGKAGEVMDQLKEFGKPLRVDYLAPVPDEERKQEEKKE
jgi:zinc protease